ncbi:hypothetical protein K457DRAFT_131978 [Linnemannia elongata AG-77]|uniref:Uncharacterized protein n=1 Tax=Linnemannia elongata AG-77 TaxID=1314771 RepID=A0A197KH35_9FUNG|nr:hypothetical protein K457DRAFT_131978 [Linnemannia elongata AG-77]
MLAMLLWNIYNGMLGCSDARLIAAVDGADVDVDVNVVNVVIVIVVVVVVVVVVNPRDICCVLFCLLVSPFCDVVGTMLRLFVVLNCVGLCFLRHM